MENLFEMNFTKQQVDAISNLGLAHVGDGVFELLVRSWLCCRGDCTVKTLHRDSVALVKAPAQAKLMQAILPHLTEREQGYYRRGKNAHTHAAPGAATPREYAMATGLETLFGALWLYGEKDRLQQLFLLGMEAQHGI